MAPAPPDPWRELPDPASSIAPVDGGVIDRLDKTLSAPIFRLQLGLVMESILSVPGCFFGMPAVMAVAPGLTAVCVHVQRHGQIPMHHRSAASLAGLGMTTIWLFWQWMNVLSAADGVSRAWILYSPRVFIAAPVAGLILSYTATDDEVARASAALYLVSWFVTVLPILALKGLCRRRRPLASDAVHIGPNAAAAAKKKALSTIVLMLRKGDPNAAFPSGDVAGAVSFAYPLWRCGGLNAGVAAMLVLLSAFGRMYWHAHHALDVIVAALIAVVCCVGIDGALSVDGGCPAVKIYHPFIALGALVVQQLLKPQQIAGLKGREFFKRRTD